MVTDIFANNAAIFVGVSKIISLVLLILLVFYSIFAFMVVRQVQLLNRSFKTEKSYILTAFAYSHMIGTLLLLLITLLSFI